MRTTIWLLTTLLLSSCSGDKTGNDREIVLGDTLTTKNGVKYIFTKIGSGRPVKTGCKVYTYLALSVNGKEVWNTNEEKDSLFVFVANKDRMIRGFTEVTMLLHEGDEIVAILPPGLAYGENGAGDVIPPNATLVYTKYAMKKVDAARLSLSDTLFAAYRKGGHEKMIATRDRIMNSPDTTGYYYGKKEWRILWNLLTEAGMTTEALQMIAYANTDNDSGLRYFRVRTYQMMEQLKPALDSLDALMQSDTSYAKNDRAIQLRAELMSRLKR